MMSSWVRLFSRSALVDLVHGQPTNTTEPELRWLSSEMLKSLDKQCNLNEIVYVSSKMSSSFNELTQR